MSIAEDRLNGYEPVTEPVVFDPTAPDAVGDVLAVRRAINELAVHPGEVPLPEIEAAKIAVEGAVEASFIAHKPTEPATTPVHVARAYRRMRQDTDLVRADELEPTSGYDVGLDLNTIDAVWRPTNPQVVTAAREPLKFDPATATVAKVALEEVARKNLASVDDDVEVEEVLRARVALEDLFGEEAEVLPPEPPHEPELPYVVKQPQRRFGRLALVALVALHSLRRR